MGLEDTTDKIKIIFTQAWFIAKVSMRQPVEEGKLFQRMWQAGKM